MFKASYISSMNSCSIICLLTLLSGLTYYCNASTKGGMNEEFDDGNGEVVPFKRTQSENTVCPGGYVVCRLNYGFAEDMCCSCIDFDTRVTSAELFTLRCNNTCRAHMDLVNGIWTSVFCCTCLDLIPPITTTPPPTTTAPPPTTTTAPPPPPLNCFPSTARVNLVNGKSLTMSELQIGDKVQTVSSSGSVTSSKITFLKKQRTVTTMYRSITTTSNTSITLSENHLIFARSNLTHKFIPIYSNQVLIGNELLVQGNSEFNPQKVVNISSFIMQGAYVPLTREGNILVDDVLASCYPFADYDLAHFAMTPMGLFPKMIQQIFGEDNGVQVYTNIADELGKWVLPHGTIY